MEIAIERYTKERIPDALQFEHELRREDASVNWDIGEKYLRDVTNSFGSEKFADSVSLLAYAGERVVGRIDCAIVASHFDGSIKAYLDWICVLKSFRHNGVAQSLMEALRRELKRMGVDTMMGLIDSGAEAQSFYRSMENAKIRDEGIWIDI